MSGFDDWRLPAGSQPSARDLAEAFHALAGVVVRLDPAARVELELALRKLGFTDALPPKGMTQSPGWGEVRRP